MSSKTQIEAWAEAENVCAKTETQLPPSMVITKIDWEHKLGSFPTVSIEADVYGGQPDKKVVEEVVKRAAKSHPQWQLLPKEWKMDHERINYHDESGRLTGAVITGKQTVTLTCTAVGKNDVQDHQQLVGSYVGSYMSDASAAGVILPPGPEGLDDVGIPYSESEPEPEPVASKPLIRTIPPSQMKRRLAL